jgi:hypothetical protein
MVGRGRSVLISTLEAQFTKVKFLAEIKFARPTVEDVEEAVLVRLNDDGAR